MPEAVPLTSWDTLGADCRGTWRDLMSKPEHQSWKTKWHLVSEVPEVTNPPFFLHQRCCMLSWASSPLPKSAGPSPGLRKNLQTCPCSQKTPWNWHVCGCAPIPQPLIPAASRFDCIYGHLICASSQDQIYLQVLISFRLIEVQAHEVSVFDPQIGYESQSNRLIFTRSCCPGLQAARKKSMKSANDSQFIEQLPF